MIYIKNSKKYNKINRTTGIKGSINNSVNTANSNKYNPIYKKNVSVSMVQMSNVNGQSPKTYYFKFGNMIFY